MDIEQDTTGFELRTDVQIVYHFGAPFSENEHLIWSLRKNSVLLKDHGVSAPRPRKSESAVSSGISVSKDETPSLDEQTNYIRNISGGNVFNRIIVSGSNFLGSPTWMLSGGQFYPNAARNISRIRNLLPDNPCEYFVGLSNPVKCMSAAFGAQTTRSHSQFFKNIELEKIKWSSVISEIRRSSPGVPITVWCDEDTPILWPTIMREISGLGVQAQMDGEFDIIRRIMSKDGAERMEAYLASHPNLNELQRRRVKAEFLHKYVVDSAVEEEIELKGWTDETVDDLTEIYFDDVETIERIPGVTVISA